MRITVAGPCQYPDEGFARPEALWPRARLCATLCTRTGSVGSVHGTLYVWFAVLQQQQQQQHCPWAARCMKQLSWSPGVLDLYLN
jgi:hypothetical protein